MFKIILAILGVAAIIAAMWMDRNTNDTGTGAAINPKAALVFVGGLIMLIIDLFMYI